MNRIAMFEKVSFEQFFNDFKSTFPLAENKFDSDDFENYVRRIYDKIKLPCRATSGSAGYDFHMPLTLTLGKGENIKIPTGIKCKIENGWVLSLYPRSSHGFKSGIHLANTVGIIDSDYYNNENNEGHIFVKLVNDSSISKLNVLDDGTAFCQGIFLPFGITENDKNSNVRKGGFGSTNNK